MNVKKSLVFGVAILLVVVVLWVGSAALSRYLYTEGHYNKPFFTTYFKTSLLSIYLVAFLFWRPWQRLCCCASKSSKTRREELECNGQTKGRTGEETSSVRFGIGEEESKRLLEEDEDEGSEKETGESAGIVCVKVTADGVEEEDDLGSGHRVARKEVWSEGDRGNAGVGEVVGVAEAESGRGGAGHGERCKKTCPIPIVEGSGDKLYLIGCLKSPDRTCPLRSHLTPSPTKPAASSRPLPSPPASSLSTNSTSSLHMLTPNDTLQGRRDDQSFHDDQRGNRCGHEDQQRHPGACAVGEEACPVVMEGACAVGEEVCPIGEKVCPVRDYCPFLRYYKVKTCTLGPPMCRPLYCEQMEGSKENMGKDSSCQTKCGKVSFCSQVEVRELKVPGESSKCVRKFDKRRDLERHARRIPSPILPVHHVMVLAVVFGIVWFFANYLYSLALVHSSVAIVNTMSATSGVFVMVLAALPCLTVTEGDKFTIPRCCVTMVSVAGAILVAFSSSGSDKDDDEKKGAVLGAVLALAGSALYALYLVLLRRFVKDTDSLEIPMFFGFVGLFDCLLLFPVLLLWHFVHLEPFEVPPTPDTWTLLLVNGLAGTVLSELLWLWGVFLTSPLLGTLALSLVTPFSITYSIVMGDAVFSWLFLLGAVLIFLGFVGVVILEQLGAWDPVWTFIKRLYSKDAQLRNSCSKGDTLAFSPPLSSFENDITSQTP